jgi:hypothetical protein
MYIPYFLRIRLKQSVSLYTPCMTSYGLTSGVIRLMFDRRMFSWSRFEWFSPSYLTSAIRMDISVGIVTDYVMEGRGSVPRQGQDNFFYNSQTGSGVRSASYAMGTGGCSHPSRRPVSGADHSPLSSVSKSRIVGAISPLTICLRGAVLS